ncbi:hypothetical protein FRC11_003524 [Ceratobasidium sp. 423]|nr:hypothetical protein FRC11_003524 [Ceratobasidium sp. 423]
MPPQTRSRTRAAGVPITEVGTTKRGATRKSASKSIFKAPPKKKARSNKPSSQKETEKLPVSQFAGLPIELLVDIAKYLHPLDFIHLSRANRFLRSMFMRRPAVGVWRAALASSGLPPCPDDSMSEPRYAALIFLEQCSECHKPGNHRIDPILLVRLCCACRKHMALSKEDVGEIERVLNYSPYLMPPWEDKWTRWYLLREYEEMKEKFCKLKERNFNAWYAWVCERVELIRARHERAGPLVKWLGNRDEERRGSINKLQRARAAQVTSRLLDLGWKRADIDEAINYSDEWKSLVYKAKPLTNKDWKDMLPCLLGGLEGAREVRLKEESRRRAWYRESIIKTWLYSLTDQIRPMDLTLRWKELNNGSITGSKDRSNALLYPQGIVKQDITISIPSMPPVHPVIENCPPQVRELLNEDIPTGEFQLKFQGKQRWLKKHYVNWRPNLEATLVQTLPDYKNLKPVELQNSDFSLVATDDTGDLAGPSNRLSLDLRVLLRADVRFTTACYLSWNSMHYPDRHLGGWTMGTGTPTHDAVSSRIAQAILCEIHQSDASYLEMRALGQSFLCSRCTDDPKYYTWDGIVNHYAFHDASKPYGTIFNQVRFLHDINNEGPLVRFVPTQDQAPQPENPNQDVV